MDILISVVLPLGLAFIMLSLGLGLAFADFARVATRPFSFLIGAVNQVFLLPALAFVIAKVFSLPPELAVGFMILSFCPGGVTSNIMTRLAKGDVALSVSLTAVISLTSMITLPFLLAWSVSHFMGSAAEPVNIAGVAISMFLLTALPVLVGVTLRRFFPVAVERVEPFISKVATALFVVIVIAALASNWSLFVDNLPVLAPSLLTLNVGLLVIGFLVAAAMGLSVQERKTISIETGVQNSTLGITVATLMTGAAAGFTAFSLPSAVYGILMYIVVAPAIVWFRRR